jgi:hypothetical protein
MMKTIKRTISNAKAWSFALIIGVCSFFSCVDDINFGDKFLEKAPSVDVNIDSIFAKGENAKQFLWHLYGDLDSPFTYNAMIGYNPLEALTDITHSYNDWGQVNYNYYPGTLTEANQASENDKFSFIGNRSIWGAIRRGWIFVENIDRVPDMNDTEKSQLKGEAYLIMATRYFDAFKNFGGLPLVDHAFVTGEQVDGGRATAEQTVEFIDGLLLKAIAEPGFPWRIEDVETYAGRMIKAGAVGMRAKLYLFAASPLFNDDQPYREYSKDEEGQDILHVWYGGKKNEYWTKCKQACEDFFQQNSQNGNYFQLIQPQTTDEKGYCDAYRAAYWFRGNSEKLIEVHNTYWGEEWGASGDARGQAHFGGSNPTLEFMEMFPMANGKNYPYKDIYGTGNPGDVDIFADRDPRLYESLVVTREKLLQQYQESLTSIELWKGGNIEKAGFSWEHNYRFPTGMGMYKWILDFGWHYPRCYAYLRMADMHLIYAEALAETGDLPKACDEVNKVRARVGLGKIEVMNPELNLTSNKGNLISEIMRERACELGWEDERLYDIIRRKMIEKFTSPLHELHTWRKTADGQKDTRDDTRLQAGEPWPSFIYEKTQITFGARRWWTSGGWDNKWLLSPLPRSEINKGYGVTQNPGW